MFSSIHYTNTNSTSIKNIKWIYRVFAVAAFCNNLDWFLWEVDRENRLQRFAFCTLRCRCYENCQELKSNHLQITTTYLKRPNFFFIFDLFVLKITFVQRLRVYNGPYFLVQRVVDINRFGFSISKASRKNNFDQNFSSYNFNWL